MPTLDLDSVKVSYREAGSGTPVILLHSSASSGGQWQSLVELLGPRHRVLAVDLHGYGQTGAWHGRRAIALADEAAIAVALARSLGETVHLVGHSYGGAVALLAALWLQRRAASLTVIEPAAFYLLRGGDSRDAMLFAEIRAVAESVAAASGRGDDYAAMAGFVDYWNGAGTWRGLPPTAQSRLAALARKVTLDFAALFTETTRRAACRTVAAPTLVLRGTRSPAPVQRIAEIVAEFAPGAALREVAGAGHMLPLTHAGEVNRLIAEHVASVAARDSDAARMRAA